jgi:hypothetical protein
MRVATALMLRAALREQAQFLKFVSHQRLLFCSRPTFDLSFGRDRICNSIEPLRKY